MMYMCRKPVHSVSDVQFLYVFISFMHTSSYVHSSCRHSYLNVNILALLTLGDVLCGIYVHHKQPNYCMHICVLTKG